MTIKRLRTGSRELYNLSYTYFGVDGHLTKGFSDKITLPRIHSEVIPVLVFHHFGNRPANERIFALLVL